jgi:hypothetical protein
MGGGDTRARVRELLAQGPELSQALYSDLLSRGPEAVAPLLELLRDESLEDPAAPGGYAPLHAALLLARLGLPEVILPLLQRLRGARLGTLLHEVLLEALEALGPAVAPLALEALEAARSPDERFALFSVLAHSGARDERIYALLLAQLQEDVVQGALGLGRYGDPRALGPLLRALDALPVDEEGADLFVAQALVELESAIQRLGGTFDAAQREKLERSRRARPQLAAMFRRLLEVMAEPEEGDPGPPGEPGSPKD